MDRFGFRMALCVVVLVLGAAMSIAQEVPTDAYVTERLRRTLPAYWKINDVKMVRTDDVGSALMPAADLRFEAVVEPTFNLFVPTGRNLGSFAIVTNSYAAGAQRTLYGTLSLKYQAGKWSGPLVVENPLDGLGVPTDMFASPTIALGSDREAQLRMLLNSEDVTQLETEFQEKLSALKTEHEKKLRAERARLQENLTDQLADASESNRTELQKIRDQYAQERGMISAKLKQEIAALETGLDARAEFLDGQLATSKELIRKNDELLKSISELKTKINKVRLMAKSLVESKKAAVSEFSAPWFGNILCRDGQERFILSIEFADMHGNSLRGRARWGASAQGTTTAVANFDAGLDSYPIRFSLIFGSEKLEQNTYSNPNRKSFSGAIYADRSIVAKGSGGDRCALNMSAG